MRFKSKYYCLTLLVVTTMCISSCVDFRHENTSLNNNPKASIILEPTVDFNYEARDNNIRIQSDTYDNESIVVDDNEFGKFVHIFNNSSHNYNIQLLATLDISQRSKYKLNVSGNLITEFQNPESHVDSLLHVHRINNVKIDIGDSLVIYSSYDKFNEQVNNKKVNATWSKLILTPSN